jgi:hypothetical protein
MSTSGDDGPRDRTVAGRPSSVGLRGEGGGGAEHQEELPLQGATDTLGLSPTTHANRLSLIQSRVAYPTRGRVLPHPKGTWWRNSVVWPWRDVARIVRWKYRGTRASHSASVSGRRTWEAPTQALTGRHEPPSRPGGSSLCLPRGKRRLTGHIYLPPLPTHPERDGDEGPFSPPQPPQAARAPVEEVRRRHLNLHSSFTTRVGAAHPDLNLRQGREPRQPSLMRLKPELGLHGYHPGLGIPANLWNAYDAP